MDNRERAKRFLAARTGLNRNGEEGKLKVYELTGVPASAIVAYENPESARMLNVEYVQKLADHYGVNAAWLLGQSESWSCELDVKKISEMTGLSAEAIWTLQDLMKDESRKSFVNAFLASGEFQEMVHIMAGVKRVKSPDDSGAVDYASALSGFSGEMDTTMNESDFADLRLWKASRVMEKVMCRIAEEK